MIRQSLAALFAAALTCACQAQEAAIPAKVEDVLARTRTTQATYALYSWNRITEPGQPPIEEWAAEFHSGDLHRVETPRDRVVADCRRRTGHALSLVTGQITSGEQIAAAACGVNANFKLIDAKWLGQIQGPFGVLDRVSITDEQHIRTYDVNADGVLVRAVYEINKPDRAPLIVSDALAVERELPSRDIFDQASLAKSYVPTAIRDRKASPAPPGR